MRGPKEGQGENLTCLTQLRNDNQVTVCRRYKVSQCDRLSLITQLIWERYFEKLVFDSFEQFRQIGKDGIMPDHAAIILDRAYQRHVN